MASRGIAVRLAAGLMWLAAGAAAEVGMVEADAAERAAGVALRAAAAEGAPDVAAWRELSAGAALAVAEVTGAPSYWLVPLRSGAKAVGFVRVGADGGVAAMGFTCRAPEAPETCPDPVFAMSSEEIGAQVGAMLGDGETADAPRLVHDGPPGREVWLTATRLDGAAHRWIFTSPGGSYVRAAGALHGEDPAVE